MSLYTSFLPGILPLVGPGIRSVVAGPLVDSWQIVRLVDRAFGVGTVRGSVDNDERRIPRPGLQNQSQHDVGETRNFRFVGIIF
uniref:Secreted protein n=1 Tax=Trichogramma kaykai TaxID=54128 RepID=A0ABD2VRM9_9HYME